MTYLISGPPRTKKTSNRLVMVRGRHRILPSKANEDWTAYAVLQLNQQAARYRKNDPACIPITVPVNCRALIYREANVGDAVGFYQAIADVLQAAGVVENDRLIVSWDGSRLLKDARDPRVEILLSWP